MLTQYGTSILLGAWGHCFLSKADGELAGSPYDPELKESLAYLLRKSYHPQIDALTQYGNC